MAHCEQSRHQQLAEDAGRINKTSVENENNNFTMATVLQQYKAKLSKKAQTGKDKEILLQASKLLALLQEGAGHYTNSLGLSGPVKDCFARAQYGDVFLPMDKLNEHIINTADEWIFILKRFISQLELSPDNFADHKKFIFGYYAQLQTYKSFYFSSEYAFITGMLIRQRSFIQLYTLEELFKFKRISSFVDRFYSFYRQAEFEFASTDVFPKKYSAAEFAQLCIAENVHSGRVEEKHALGIHARFKTLFANLQHHTVLPSKIREKMLLLILDLFMPLISELLPVFPISPDEACTTCCAYLETLFAYSKASKSRPLVDFYDLNSDTKECDFGKDPLLDKIGQIKCFIAGIELLSVLPGANVCKQQLVEHLYSLYCAIGSAEEQNTLFIGESKCKALQTELYASVLKTVTEQYIATTEAFIAACDMKKEDEGALATSLREFAVSSSAYARVKPHPQFRQYTKETNARKIRTLYNIYTGLKEDDKKLHFYSDAERALDGDEIHPLAKILQENNQDLQQRTVYSIKEKYKGILNTAVISTHKREEMENVAESNADATIKNVSYINNEIHSTLDYFLLYSSILDIEKYVCGLRSISEFYETIKEILDFYRFTYDKYNDLFRDDVLDSFIGRIVGLKWKYFAPSYLEVLNSKIGLECSHGSTTLVNHCTMLKEKICLFGDNVSSVLEEHAKSHIYSFYIKEIKDYFVSSKCSSMFAESIISNIDFGSYFRKTVYLDLQKNLEFFVLRIVRDEKISVEIEGLVVYTAGISAANFDEDCLVKCVMESIFTGKSFSKTASTSGEYSDKEKPAPEYTTQRIYNDEQCCAIFEMIKAKIRNGIDIIRYCRRFSTDSHKTRKSNFKYHYYQALIKSNRVPYFRIEVQNTREFPEMEIFNKLKSIRDGYLKYLYKGGAKVKDSDASSTSERLLWIIKAESVLKKIKKTIRNIKYVAKIAMLSECESSREEIASLKDEIKEIYGKIQTKKGQEEKGNAFSTERIQEAVDAKKTEILQLQAAYVKALGCYEPKDSFYKKYYLQSSKTNLSAEKIHKKEINTLFKKYKAGLHGMNKLHEFLGIERMKGIGNAFRDAYSAYLETKKLMLRMLEKPLWLVADEEISWMCSLAALNDTPAALFLSNVHNKYTTAAEAVSEYQLNKPEASAYYDSKTLFGEFLLAFNGETVREDIRKGKSRNEIGKYINNFGFNILDELQELCKAVNTQQSLSEEHRRQHLTSNLTKQLEDEKNKLLYIARFNTFSLFVDEINLIKNSLLLQENILDRIKVIEKHISQMEGISQVALLQKESKSYIKMRDEYYASLRNHTNRANETQVDRIVALNGILDSFAVSIKSYETEFINILNLINIKLDQYRESCGRLYFLSNKKLFAMMKDREVLLAEVARLLGFKETETHENEITALINHSGQNEPEDHKSSTSTGFSFYERIVLCQPIPLSEPLHKLINKLDASLQKTLRDKLDKGETDISQIKEIKYELELKDGTLLPEDEGLEETDFEKRAVLYRNKVISRCRFKDASQLYPHLNIKTDRNELTAENLHAGPYKYKYSYSAPSSFIFTNLTLRIFSSIEIARNKSGLILYGPSGTGKTESVKHYCRAIGQPLVVYCCSEGNEYASLEKIIHGCVLTDSFLCLDEFNRLTRETMSSIAETIALSRGSIKFFLTLNMGYKARSPLPKNLKDLFMEVLVSEPNIKEIAEFYTGDNRLFNFMQELEERVQSSTERVAYYEFGLRALNALAARYKAPYSDALQQLTSKNHNKNFIYNTDINNKYPNDIDINNKYPNDIDINNKYLHIIENIVWLYATSLRKEHRMHLNALLMDIYKIRIDVNLLDRKMLLETTLLRRIALLIEGGDHEVEIMRQIGKYTGYRVFVYNPMNIVSCVKASIGNGAKHSSYSLFGHANTSSDSGASAWRDSPFIEDLRKANGSAAEDEILGKALFIFDGPANSKWIEDFNSLFDENKTICIPSGEIISVEERHRFVFITPTFEELTPATFSRMMVVSKEVVELESLDTMHIETEKYSLNGLYNTNHSFCLTEEQTKFRNDILEHLERQRICVVHGTHGDGKESIIRDLFETTCLFRTLNGKDSELLWSLLNHMACKGSLEKQYELAVFYIRDLDINNSEITEVIREFGKFGSIANKEYKKIKIIVGIENDTRRSASATEKCVMKYLGGAIELLRSKNIKQIICSVFKNASSEIMQVAEFLNKENRAIADILRFVKISQKCEKDENNPECYLNRLFFAYKMIFSDENLKAHLETEFGCKINSIQHCLENDRSFVQCALKNSLNVVVRGPRLSGKTEYVGKILAGLSITNTEKPLVVHWNEHRNSKANAIYTVCNAVAEQIRKNAILIEMEHKEYHLNAVEYLEKRMDEEILRMEKEFMLEKAAMHPSAARFSMLMHPPHCSHKSIRFSNAYKYHDYLEILDERIKYSCAKERSRQLFLARGIANIAKCREKITQLEKDIETKEMGCSERQERLTAVMDEILREKETIEANKIRVNEKKCMLKSKIESEEEVKGSADNKIEDLQTIIEEIKSELGKINKQTISEIKMMGSPPAVIREVIEYVYFFLENREMKNWKELQSYIKKDDFISGIRRKSSEILLYSDSKKESRREDGNKSSSGRLLGVLREKLQQNKELTNERADKASKACGALLRWLKGSIKYSATIDELELLNKQVMSIGGEITEMEKEFIRGEKELEAIEKKLMELERNREETKHEIAAMQKSIEEMKDSKIKFKEVLLKISEEENTWKDVSYECPIKYMEDQIFAYDKKRVFYIAGKDYEQMANDYAQMVSVQETCEEEFSGIKGTVHKMSFDECSRHFFRNSVVISQEDSFLKDEIEKIIEMKQDVVITDVDAFSTEIYKLIKTQMRNKSFNIFLIGNYKNIFAEETYEWAPKKSLAGNKEEKDIEEIENRLLEEIINYEVLHGEHQDGLCDEKLVCEGSSVWCDRILDIKALLDGEREIAAQNRHKKNVENALVGIYECLNAQERIPFGIYRDFVQKHGLLNECIEFCKEDIYDFYSNSMLCTKMLVEATGIEKKRTKEYFEAGLWKEIEIFSWDYCFVTDYGDIAHQLKENIALDEELSAGSSEVNRRIFSLLEEVGSKNILVKNLHLLERGIKRGTNRFFYVIDSNEEHPLKDTARVVYCDSKLEIDEYTKYLHKNINGCAAIVKRHAELVVGGMDFSMKDLKLAEQNNGVCDEYLEELIYSSRMK
ncbi:hypothetical protein ENBRE01_0648 [Enteropsectra breve]|nr:hypothetical protein ENBRE01_0648 [Enteropsectra breve]